MTHRCNITPRTTLRKQIRQGGEAPPCYPTDLVKFLYVHWGPIKAVKTETGEVFIIRIN